jgi:hypothetical protein
MTMNGVSQAQTMCGVSSAGSARAIEEPMIAAARRWGVSGGAAVAPPDVKTAPPDVT